MTSSIFQTKLLYFEIEKRRTRLIVVAYFSLNKLVLFYETTIVVLNLKSNLYKIHYSIEVYKRNTCPTTLKLRGAHFAIKFLTFLFYKGGLPREAPTESRGRSVEMPSNELGSESEHRKRLQA